MELKDKPLINKNSMFLKYLKNKSLSVSQGSKKKDMLFSGRKKLVILFKIPSNYITNINFCVKINEIVSMKFKRQKGGFFFKV